MILSGKEILKRLNKDIFISPFNKAQLNPNSYNVTLHNEIATYNTGGRILDMAEKPELEWHDISYDGFVLQPNKLYLARTAEYTKTFNLVPMLEGRSSIGRLGISIHVTAGFGDVGFEGFWTLEMTCVEPIRIYADVEIGQLYFHTIEGEYENYSSGKYNKNEEIQASKLYLERHMWRI